MTYGKFHRQSGIPGLGIQENPAGLVTLVLDDANSILGLNLSNRLPHSRNLFVHRFRIKFS